MKMEIQKKTAKKLLIRKCHECGRLNEGHSEKEKCSSCGKSFLPLNYFEKIHGDKNQKFEELFAGSDEIQEDDLIMGIYVLW